MPLVVALALALTRCRSRGLPSEPMATAFFLARESLIAQRRPGLGRASDRLVVVLAASARTAAAEFGQPANRVVGLRTQVEI